mmetsp:Transcript_5445/g.10390  ORF Transcript_5445/g.10390 Transcript_5445/m.10390 type:complete len:102 (-) Transcript_5445:419-724(-)
MNCTSESRLNPVNPPAFAAALAATEETAEVVAAADEVTPSPMLTPLTALLTTEETAPAADTTMLAAAETVPAILVGVVSTGVVDGGSEKRDGDRVGEIDGD